MTTTTKAKNQQALSLLENMASGNQTALEAFIALFKPLVTGIARANLMDKSLTDAVANEVWLAVWNNAAKFDGAKPVENWVSRIAQNSAKNQNRPINRRHAHGINTENEMNAEVFAWEKIASDSSDGDSEAEAKEKVSKVFSKLSKSEKTIITYFYFDKMSHKEIATKLCISVQNSKVRIYRIVSRLKATISKNIDDRL